MIESSFSSQNKVWSVQNNTTALSKSIIVTKVVEYNCYLSQIKYVVVLKMRSESGSYLLTWYNVYATAVVSNV